MRARTASVAVLVLALTLTGCGGDGADPSTDGSPTATSTDAASSPVDLPDGVAARVDDTDIPVEEVEQRVAALVTETEDRQSGPATEDATEGVDPEQREAALTAQVLGDLIVGHVILDGAEELGVAPTDEDVAAIREEVASSAGGEEAFMEQATEIGYDEAAIERELTILAAFQNITEALIDERGGDSGSPAPEDEQAIRQWLLDELAVADIAVDEQYGVWDAETGQVLPAG